LLRTRLCITEICHEVLKEYEETGTRRIISEASELASNSEAAAGFQNMNGM
jgi:hypothetical protein